MFPVIFELDLAVFFQKKKQKPTKKKKKKNTHTNTKKKNNKKKTHTHTKIQKNKKKTNNKQTRYLSMRNLAKDAFLYYQCLASVEIRYTCFW